MPARIQEPAKLAAAPEEPKKEGPEDDVQLSLMEHLDDLRKRLTYAVYAVIVAVGAAYFFAEKILWWLMQPVLDALSKLPHPEGVTPEDPWLTVHNSLEYFFVQLRVALYAGLFLAAPAILYQVWAFVSPALYRKERELAGPFVVLGTVFFVGGGAFARFLVLPYALEYLVGSTVTTAHVKTMFSISEELDFVLASVLAFGIIFELPLILSLLAQIGIVSSAFLAKYRRHAMVLNLIVAAIVTPTGDPFNLMLMAGPLIVCYELGIVGAKFIERRKARQKAAEAAANA